MYSPDSRNEGGNNTINNNDTKNESSETFNVKEEDKKKSFAEKIHDALQDWSNDDQRDQKFDDTRP